MLGRLPAVLPRLAAIVLGGLLATATITFAANNGSPTPTAPPPAPAPAAPTEIVVPDVRNQAYVFAKGALEDAGLAWKVAGPVQGYAANVVQSQSPAPGTRLAAGGAPIVTLQLSRNASYAQEGEPENESPYPGTTPKLAAYTPQAPVAEAEQAETAAAPAAKKPAAAPAAKKPAAPTAKPAAKQPAAKQAQARKPAFDVPGAPAEPQDEISLEQRAGRLSAWLARGPRPTDANVQHWLYQHEWIVAGARFGWHGGERALVQLIEIDRRAEAQWGIGTKSRVLAQRALAEVRGRAG